MKKIIISILGVILCLLIFLLTVASGFSYLSGLFLDESVYQNKVANDKYVDQLELILIDRLESDSLYYDIPMEYIKAGLNREELKSLSKEYVRVLVHSFKEGAQLPKVGYERIYFEEQIRKYLSDYPEIGSFYEEETIIEIADELTATVNNTLNSFLNIGVIENAARAVYSNKLLMRLSDSFYIIIGAALICAGLLILISRKSLRICAYKIIGSVWCGSVVLAVPAFLLKGNDFFSKFILNEGPFKTLLDGIYYLMLDSWVNYSTVLFIVSSVLLIASIVVLSLKKQKNEEVVDVNEEN